ncbi:hypothetical protein [Nannocystis punicea]|uniref:Uncharacterized protein n=1 Tax=Nannocystis punicea TaxID=2995304 RepID=A0ABY7GTG2_9BACT|nr:hypothetical protein [Nannocystis poenicansa]WAS90252.1 hypothetical protein O0S08_29000 [Nannocystis poenicansa]
MLTFSAFVGVQCALFGFGLMATAAPEETPPRQEDAQVEEEDLDLTDEASPAATSCDTDCQDKCTYDICEPFGCMFTNPACLEVCEIEKALACATESGG